MYPVKNTVWFLVWNCEGLRNYGILKLQKLYSTAIYEVIFKYIFISKFKPNCWSMCTSAEKKACDCFIVTKKLCFLHRCYLWATKGSERKN